MAILKSYSLAIAISLSLVYIVLALFSLGHIRNDKKEELSNTFPVYFWWWVFYSELFDDSAKKIRLVGLLSFIGAAVMYVTSFSLQNYCP